MWQNTSESDSRRPRHLGLEPKNLAESGENPAQANSTNSEAPPALRLLELGAA